MITNVKTERDPWPGGGGGFSDFYKGRYRNQVVAVEVLTIFPTDIGKNLKRICEVRGPSAELGTINLFYNTGCYPGSIVLVTA